LQRDPRDKHMTIETRVTSETIEAWCLRCERPIVLTCLSFPRDPQRNRDRETVATRDPRNMRLLDPRFYRDPRK